MFRAFAVTGNKMPVGVVTLNKYQMTAKVFWHQLSTSTVCT